MNQITPRKAAAVALHEEFDKRQAEFSAILPADVSLAEFKRVTLQAIAMNPMLLECTQVSVFRALTDAARNGWVPDGRDCYIDIRENFRTKEKSAICIPGKHGYLKNFIGKTLKDWRAHVVRRGDDYDVELGDNERFTHKVDPFAEGGGDSEIIGAYSIAIGMDGRVISREFMSLAQLLKARAKSSSYNGSKPQYSPWNTHFEEMCEKTVMKRHAERLPKQTQAAQVLGAEREIEVETAKLLETPEPKKKAVRPTKAQQTQQLEDLSNRDGEESGECGPENSTQERDAPSAATATNGAAGSGEKTQTKSTPASDASQSTNRRGPGRPRKEEAQARTDAANPARQPEKKRDKPGGGDPIHEAMQAGEAAYEDGTERTRPPREYQTGDRWDELDAWLEGWDNAAADSASAGRVFN